MTSGSDSCLVRMHDWSQSNTGLAKELIPVSYILTTLLVSQFKVSHLVQHLSDVQEQLPKHEEGVNSDVHTMADLL